MATKYLVRKANKHGNEILSSLATLNVHHPAVLILGVYL